MYRLAASARDLEIPFCAKVMFGLKLIRGYIPPPPVCSARGPDESSARRMPRRTAVPIYRPPKTLLYNPVSLRSVGF
jgi:hypothetical protein